MTRDEFIDGYIASHQDQVFTRRPDGVCVRSNGALELVAEPCDCGECDGWSMNARPEGRISMKEVCETIARADFLRKSDGTAPTGQEIFESSPTGELAQVFEWYEKAKLLLAQKSPPFTA